MKNNFKHCTPFEPCGPDCLGVGHDGWYNLKNPLTIYVDKPVQLRGFVFNTIIQFKPGGSVTFIDKCVCRHCEFRNMSDDGTHVNMKDKIDLTKALPGSLLHHCNLKP